MTKKKKTFPNQPLSSQKANELLTKGKYKEATDIYKKLLKIEQREEWQAGLAKAYLLRAKNLATKGMYKEAVVLWENRAITCNDKESFDQYIYWLVEAGYYSRAVSALMEADTYLPAETLQQLLTKFGVLLFKGNSEFMVALPKDSSLVKHYTIIQQALTAYYQNNKKLCEEHISQIPFRSPYRDFCFLFKALLSIDSNQNLANELLTKIPLDSPYGNFANLIKLAIEPHDIKLLSKLTNLSLTEQQFIAQIKGWNKQQFKAIIALQTAINKKVNNSDTVLEILINNRKIFGEQYVKQTCLAILPNCPNRIKLYEKTFTPLSEFEKNRILALNYEQQNRLLIAKKHWQICIEILTKNRHQNSLKIALILRHQVTILKQHGEFFDKKYVPEFLIESLNFDPDDKECFLDLILWYKKNNQLKDYYKWIEIAVTKLPQDNDILFMAMEAATDRKSFKKALKYAITLLKTDPINVKALNIASSSHIAHAHKLIKNARYPLAHKELQEAAKFEKAATGIIQINQGLLELQEQEFIKPIPSIKQEVKPLKPISSKELQIVTKQYPQTIKLLQAGVKLAGGRILGIFQLIIITQKQSIDFNKIYPLVTETKFKLFATKNLPTKYEALELINLINHYSEEEVNFLYYAVEIIKSNIINFIKIELSKNDMLNLCKCMKKIGHHEILEKLATNSLKRWKQQPTFIFYQIYGIAKGTAWYLSEQQLNKLEKAADNAKKQSDEYTAIMIAKFVEQMYEGIFPKNTFFDSLLDEEKLEVALEKIEANMDEIEQKDDIEPQEMQEIIKQFKELSMPITSGRKK